MPAIPKPARRGLQATARTVGRLTASIRMTPSFLIVGAKRAGTTSLYNTLAGHPQVLPAVLHKEVHYFDNGYLHGPAWYQGHFPTRAAAALAERRTGKPVMTGEATPYYMWHPLAPQRIATDLPEVRLVVLIRDPVQRAHSEHAHSVSNGWETEQFERAVELEAERLTGEVERLLAEPGYRSLHHACHAYVTRGRYVEQLERLEALVGRDRIHVIDSDALFLDAAPALDGLTAFLGLPPWQPERLKNLNARPRSSLAAGLQTRLSAELAPYDERLAAWLGWTPSWRR
ncbi:MAG: sulfotransferase domain-containing protein [Geodermatophilaceae bacterium]|nr:sulfotransferase domain-containing protein [Geodermatophilaceae bacterium]